MLDNYITTQENVINGKLAKIKELEALIEQLRKEVRLDEQIRQARVTASQELAQWLAKGKELLGDMAGIFPLEFLEDVKSELGTITEEIKEDYEKYCDNGDRFLSATGDNSETQNIEPITPINPENEITESAIEPNSETEDNETIAIEAIESNSETLEDTETIEAIEAVAVESDSEIIEDTETIEAHSENEDKVSALNALNATELAKRLGFKSHHEVTTKFKGLSKDSFIEWTIYNDPDKYGWYKVNGKYQIVA